MFQSFELTVSRAIRVTAPQMVIYLDEDLTNAATLRNQLLNQDTLLINSPSPAMHFPPVKLLHHLTYANKFISLD